MSRQKQEIIKDVQVRFRIESKFRSEYYLSCKKRKTTPSKEMREFVLKKIKE